MTSFARKIYRKSLQLAFGFDKWHVSPLEERKYAVDIIDYCNKRTARSSFAEIGCGLGDIVRNVHFDKRAGYDMDERVLKAARLLSKLKRQKNIEFGVFRFPEDSLHGALDVLAMVNWIHHIPPEILKKKIASYFIDNLYPGGELIIDTVKDEAYKFNHSIDFLTKDLNCLVYRIGAYQRQREVWAIKKPN